MSESYHKKTKHLSVHFCRRNLGMNTCRIPLTFAVLTGSAGFLFLSVPVLLADPADPAQDAMEVLDDALDLMMVPLAAEEGECMWW